MKNQIEIKLPYRTSGDFFPEIVCKDGFKMSVQASEFHYCSPRTNEHEMLAMYDRVEVGFPNMVEGLLMPYQDGEGSNVYGHVPLEVVREIIRKHGGVM